MLAERSFGALPAGRSRTSAPVTGFPPAAITAPAIVTALGFITRTALRAKSSALEISPCWGLLDSEREYSQGLNSLRLSLKISDLHSGETPSLVHWPEASVVAESTSSSAS